VLVGPLAVVGLERALHQKLPRMGCNIEKDFEACTRARPQPGTQLGRVQWRARGCMTPTAASSPKPKRTAVNTYPHLFHSRGWAGPGAGASVDLPPRRGASRARAAPRPGSATAPLVDNPVETGEKPLVEATC
jgi:hypothetical protein